MKWNKYLSMLLAAMAFSTTPVYADADIDLSDVGSENIEKPAQQGPISVTIDFDAVGKTKITKGFFEGDRFQFAEAEADIGFIFYYCPRYEEGASVGLAYSITNFEWAQNPWFEQQQFNTVTLNLTGFTHRLEKWFWRGQFAMNVDVDNGYLSGEYANYDALGWGRYDYSDDVGVHVGILVQTGMQMDRVYPIVGFDWQISKRLKLNLVYPVNVSLDYQFARHWTASLAGRFFNNRHRVRQHDSQGRFIVRYENVGAEFAIKYEKGGLNANLHAGYTLGGKFRIANPQNDEPHTYRLEGAPYIGAEVIARF